MHNGEVMSGHLPVRVSFPKLFDRVQRNLVLEVCTKRWANLILVCMGSM